MDLPQNLSNGAAAVNSSVSSVALGESVVLVPRPVDHPLRVAFIGDSLTVGQSATASERTFRQRIIDSWGGSGQVRADEYARAGFTTSQVDRLVPPGKQVNVAIVETGTNDFWQRMAPEQVKADYGTLLDKIRAASPRATLICLGVWQRPVDANPYDLEIKDQCSAHGGRFMPLAGIYDLEGVRGPANVPLEGGGVSDAFHPNDVGHLKIASVITSSVVVT